MWLLFSKEGELAKNEVIFSLITFYVLISSYINYSLVNEIDYFNKVFIAILALLAIIANLTKKNNYIITRILINVAILMNIYFLLS